MSVLDRMCCVLSGRVKPLDVVDYIAHTPNTYTHMYTHTWTHIHTHIIVYTQATHSIHMHTLAPC